MKHAHGGENTSRSCSCTSCISVSTSPSLQRIINQGSKIDKRFDGTFFRLRQKKLIEKLIKTRAVYDDVRKQLLSGSINENASLKLKVHTASTKELDDIERSSAVLQLVDLVDKGVLLGPHKLNECCSCCSCSSKTRLHDYRYRGSKYSGYTRDQNLRSKSSVISNRSHRNGTQLKRGLKFKAKHIQSEPCTCTLKLSGLLKHHSKLRHKKPKVVAKDDNIKFYKEENKTLTPEYMNKKAREPIKHTSSKTAIKSRIQSEIKKSREKLQHAKTTIRDRMDSMQREYEKRELIIPSPPEIEEKRLFHIRKDSITKFKERLKRKKELLNYECEPECNPEECAPEECLKKIQLSKILKGKHTGHKKKKSRKNQASSGHSLKRCLCPFKIHTHTEPKVNAIATETPRFLAHKTFESRMIDTTMEVEKNSAGVSKPQKNRCFCMLKLHTIGKLAQNDENYGRITKPTTDMTPKVSTKATRTKLQRIDKKNITQCDCFEKLKRNKRSKNQQPRSMTTPTETQTIKHKMHLQSIECEPNICMPGVCDPYECFEKNKKQDRHLQTKLRTPTNHSKMLIATSNATQNLNETNLNSYECEPYDCIPEKCNRHECLENIKNRDIYSSSDSGKQRNKSKMTSRGSIAKSKIKRHIYTKARKSYYKPASLSSNSNEVTKVLGRSIKISSSFSFSIEFSKSGSNPIENTNILTNDLLQPINQVPKINKITTMHDKSLAMKRPILKRCLCSLNLQHNKSKRLQTPNIYAVHRLLFSKTIENENTLNVYSLSKLIHLNCSLSEKNKLKDNLSCSPEKQEPLHGRRIQHYIMSSNVIDEGDRQNHCKYSAICFSQSNKKNNHFGFHEEIHAQDDTHQSKDKYNISDTTYNNNLSRSDVTGVSRLLKPCFCTMNIQIPSNMKKKHGKPECNTLAPFECEPRVCIAYECDSNECQKVVMKRNKKQTSTMTGEKLTSRANTTPQTVFKDATAGIKSKALKPDKRTLSRKPPFKVSLNRPSPSRHIVRLSSNINFNIQFSKERLLKQPAEETHSKITDQIISKQKLERVKTKRHNSQKFTTKTEDKSADILPKRHFCTLKLHKAPKQIEAIENIDQFTKAPKRFLRDTYKLPPVNTGQNTKKNWRPERLYEDKKTQTKNLDIQAKDSSTQITFYDKGINKQNQTQRQGDEKLVKTYVKPDIPLRQGIRIGSSLSFNIEFYKEKSPELQTEFSKAEFYKKMSHQLQGVSSKIKRRVSQRAVRGMKSKAKKGVKTKSDMKPKVKGKKTNIVEPQLKSGKIMSDVQLISKGIKSKSDLKPKSKEEKNIHDLQSSTNAKEKNPKIQEQTILRNVDKQPAHHEEPQATETRSLLSKEHKLGNFVENNTLSFKRCFCKKKEKKIPRQIVCMDKPIPESPSQSFLKKCACAFACNNKNCNKQNEILTYHIQEHRFTNLLPYECQPGICIPGECNPYDCDKIIKRRHLKQGTKLSGTERLKTNSTSSYYNPSTKSRSNQSKYYTRLKENKQQSHISRDNNSSDRQTVRIGSNINFNFEFYKTGPGLSGEESLTKNYTRTKPKTKSQGSFSDISKHNRDAQAVKTQTEHSSVGTELKRCFCTLKYNLIPSSARQGTRTLREENKGMKKGVTVQMRGRGLERHNHTPYQANTRNMIQQTRFPAMNHIPYTLEPHECEPNVCIPGDCDPYECLRRVNRQYMKFRTHGTSPRNNGTKSTSSMAYSMSDNKSKRIQYGPKKRYNTRSMQSKPNRFRQPINSTSSETGRKAVKISSSLHLSIEFTKGGCSQGPEKHMSPKFVKPRKIRNENVHTRERKYNDTTLQTNVPKTESKGSGVGPLLKRCFCTLKLQKVGNLQQNVTQLQQNSLSTPVRSVKTNTKKKERFSEPKSRDIAKNIRVGPFLLEQHELGSMPVTEMLMKSKQKKTKPTRIPKLNVVESMTVATNTMTRQPRNVVTRPLKLYECEPGICVPGVCDPYQCYERIKRRQMRSSGVGTDMIKRKNASNVYDGDSKSIGIQSLKEKIRHSTPSQTKNRHYENRAGYVRNDECHDGSRAVRVGSNINFNIEFYKDSSMKKEHIALRKRVRDKEKEYYNRDKPKTRQAGVSPVLIPIKNANSQGAEVKFENKASGVHNALKRCFCTLKLHDSNLKTRYMDRHSSQSSKLPERQEKTVGVKKKPKIDSKKLKTESKRHSVCDKYSCISNKRDIKVTELLNNELATSQRYLFIDDSYNSNTLPKFPSHRQKKRQKVIAVNRVAVEELRNKFYKHPSQSSTEIRKRRNEKNVSNNHLCDTVYYRTCATKEPYCKDSVQKMAYNNKGPDLNGMNTIYPYVPSKFKKHKSKMLLIDNYKQDNLLQGCYRKTCNKCSITKMTKRKSHKKITQGSPLKESESKKNKVFGWHFKAFFSRFACRFSTRKEEHMFDITNKIEDYVNNPSVDNKTRQSKYASNTKQIDGVRAPVNHRRRPIENNKISKTNDQNKEIAVSHNLSCKCSYKNNFICSYCQIKYQKIASSPYIHNKIAQFSLIPPVHEKNQRNNINEQLNDRKITNQHKVLRKYINLSKKNAEVIKSESKTEDILYKCKDGWTSPESVKDDNNVPISKIEKKIKRLRFQRSINQNDKKSAIVDTQCQGCDNKEQRNKTSVSKYLALLFKSNGKKVKRVCGIMKNCGSDECQDTVSVRLHTQGTSQENPCMEKTDTNPLVRSLSQTKKSLSNKRFFHKKMNATTKNKNNRHGKSATIYTQCNFRGIDQCNTINPLSPLSEYKKDLPDKNVKSIQKNVPTKPAPCCTCRVCQNLNKPFKNKPKSKGKMKISDNDKPIVRQVMADRCRKLSGGDHLSNAICHQTRIQGYQRLKKVYDIPKSKMDDKPCIYKPLFSVGPNLCARCIEGDVINDSRKFDNVGTEPKIKSCIKRTRCNQQFCTCTKKPCVCHVCPKTTKVIELSSGNWLSPVRHLFINDKYETIADKTQIKYARPEDTCEKTRTMLKVEGCGTKLKVIPKNAPTANKTFGVLGNFNPKTNANSANDPISKFPIKNVDDAVVFTRKSQNSSKQKYQNVLEHAKSNLTKKLDETVPFNKEQMQTSEVHKSQHLKNNHNFGSPTNEDITECDKEECPVPHDERHSQQEKGPLSKLLGIKGILDKSNRNKFPRDPTTCYKDICPAGKNYKKAVKKAKQLEAKRKKKLIEAAKRDEKNKQKKKRDFELKKKELKLNKNAKAIANKAKRREARLKGCVCSETCKTHLNKEIDIPPEIPAICQIFDTCTCGASICAKEVRKARFAKLPPEMQKRILAKRKLQKAAKVAERKRIKQRTLEYQKQDSIRLKKRQEQDAIHAKGLKKSLKNASTSVLLAESILDIGKLGFRASAGLFRFASRAVRDPKQVVASFRSNAKDPKKLKKSVGDTLGSIGLMSTFSRVGKRMGSMDKIKQLGKKLEQNEYTNYIMHARSPKKRTAAAKVPRRRSPPVDFGCSLFMATLRRKRCLAIYYLCPWFYPHCLSLLHIWRQITDVILFLLAVAVWSPCILAMELCRAFVCCAFCQA